MTNSTTLAALRTVCRTLSTLLPLEDIMVHKMHKYRKLARSLCLQKHAFHKEIYVKGAENANICHIYQDIMRIQTQILDEIMNHKNVMISKCASDIHSKHIRLFKHTCQAEILVADVRELNNKSYSIRIICLALVTCIVLRCDSLHFMSWLPASI